MLYINESFCKGCSLCVESCPKKVLEQELGKVRIVNEENCIECGICENICPDFAIHLRRDKHE
ncbi:4Fe-4S binding protein [Clostridium sp. MSJ-4]|uniref:4Fe-4S binding protein n=1 Tax=Clostridium simiarum TaxID=2841506 RepID=A0ABS6F0V3_9CLOT|nr:MULTISPECIES: 4Fe-4S binding protein [Clostridium]MBU5591504.1 4Fe-4S binding protein [Clostridium simiarum]